MEGLVLLLLFALAGGPRPTKPGDGGNGKVGGLKTDNYPGGPAGVGPVPKGDPPGGCRLVYQTPAATLEALMLMGYSPLPQIWGPDGKLGTFDASADPDVRQFQLDYNQASRSRWIGNAGGLATDGMMGRCTMAGMAHALAVRGAAAWRERYMQRHDLAPGG